MFRRSQRFSHRECARFRPELVILEDRLSPGQTGIGSAVALSLFGPALSSWQLDELGAPLGDSSWRRSPATTNSSATAIVPATPRDVVGNLLQAPSKSTVVPSNIAVNDSTTAMTTAIDRGTHAAQRASLVDPRLSSTIQFSPERQANRPGQIDRPIDDADGRNTIVGPNTLTHNLNLCGNSGKTQSETAITHSGNTVVVAYNDSRGFFCSGYHGTGWAYSTDRGRTFTEGAQLPGSSHVGDPWLATGPDGSIYLTDLRSGLSAMNFMKGTPTEAGVTWGSPIAVASGASPDRESMAVDPNNGNIYISFTRFAGGTGIWLARSTDGGASFSAPVVATSSSSTQGSAVAVGPNGEVYVTWQNNAGTYTNPTGIGFARSLDFGQSFTPVGNIATNTGTFVAGTDRTPQLPQIAVDLSGGANDGNIYVVYHSSHLGGGSNLHDALLVRSTDGGLNWSSPSKINDDGTTAPQWFPTIDVDSFGNVHSFFYDRRGESGTNTNLYYARSTNGGVGWEANVRVSSVAFSTSNAGADIQPYYGDYINADTQGKSGMVAYADGRNGTPDTFFTRVGNRD